MATIAKTWNISWQAEDELAYWWRIESLPQDRNGNGKLYVTIQYFIARNINDLCTALVEGNVTYPIASVKKYNRPLYGNPTAPATFSDVDFSSLYNCSQFSLITGQELPNVKMGVQTTLDVLHLFRARITPEIITSDTDLGDFRIKGGTKTLKLSESGGFPEETLSEPINMIPNMLTTRRCTFIAASNLILTHNFEKIGKFKNFITRNNISFPDQIILLYESSTVWRTHLHYQGIGENNNTQEKWTLVFEWSCTNRWGEYESTNQNWVFSATILRELASNNPTMYTTKTTRMVFALLPQEILSNEPLNLSFNVNTTTKNISVRRYRFSTSYSQINDEIGIFSDHDWGLDPRLLVSIASYAERKSTTEYNISSFIPS